MATTMDYIDFSQGAEERVEKSRERNREHAKRTRLRKKQMIEGMKGRLLELQNEVRNQNTSKMKNPVSHSLMSLSSLFAFTVVFRD